MVDHEHVPHTDPRSPVNQEMAGGNTPIRVLLADDHAVVRTGIRQILERAEDIRVVAEAADGEEAKALIETVQPAVVVLDIQMPKASGIDVTRWIRGRQIQTGVLILTAYDDDPYVLALLQAGANGYVLKTAAPDEIVEAVREVHVGRSVLDQQIAEKLLAQARRPKPAPAPEPLTSREAQVLALAGKGFTNKAIGVQLSISDRTVQGHLAKIFNKLDAESRTEAVMKAVSNGWIEVEI